MIQFQRTVPTSASAFDAAPRAHRPLGRAAALLVLAVIIVLAAALRVYTFRGFLGLDDGEYVNLAYDIAAGVTRAAPYSGPSVFPLRVGLTVPAALAIKAFGVAEWPMVVYPFILSLASIALAYACATILFDRRAGLIAAALTAFMTWQVEAGTTLLPDLPGTFFGALGVTLLFAVLRLDSRRPAPVFGIGLGAGLAFGISWLCKESVVYAVPFCMALMAISVKRDGTRAAWLWAGVAAGSLAILLGEMAVYAQITGDALYRFHETERNYTQNAKYFFTEGSRYGWGNGQSYSEAVFSRVFVTGPTVILANRQALYMPLIALAAAVYALVRRDRRFLIPSLWVWSLALMFNFASSSMSSYAPLVLFHRYVLPVFFAATIVTAGFLATLLWPARPARNRAARLTRALGLACAAAVLWVGATEVYWAAKYRPSSWAADVRTLARSISAQQPVVADTLTLRGLEFFSGYPAATAWKDFEQLGPHEPIPAGTLVIVNRRYLEWLEVNGGLWGRRTSGYARHPFYDKAPEGWPAVWRGQLATVYEVRGAGAVKLEARGASATR